MTRRTTLATAAVLLALAAALAPTLSPAEALLRLASGRPVPQDQIATLPASTIGALVPWDILMAAGR